MIVPPCKISKAQRASQKEQYPYCIWFTGLSGAGKSTFANLLDEALYKRGRHAFILDGDRCRDGICRDLDFSIAGRAENVRRIGEVAAMLVEAGLIAIVALISPQSAQRRMVRELFAEGEFFEVYVNTPLSTCEARDPKGLYKQARQGAIPNFTGLSSVYEPPNSPEFVVSGEGSPEDQVERLISSLPGAYRACE